MREVKLDLRSLYPDLETSGLHDYSILVDEMDVGSFSCESYGVCVSSKRTEERMVIPHITISIPRIDELLDKLIRNDVGPTHLKDVVDDWL